MTKQIRRTLRYHDGSWYNGWTRKGKRYFIGKLFIGIDQHEFYYGHWADNLLKHGWYFNKHLKLTALVFQQTIFRGFSENHCPICYFANTSSLMLILPCGHLYCFLCIKTWLLLRDECPVCKRTVGPQLKSRIVQ